MASQAAMSDGPASRAAIDAPLIGAEGQGFVQTALSTADPARAIAEIQERGAMRDPRCKPLLDLLDQLGLARSESHFTVMKRARDELLSRIPTLSPEKLLRLLEATFSFIGISELRAVPIAVLDRLRPVPATFLKQLAVDREVFWELPPSVQRQTWELDRKLLQLHSVSLLSAYTYETATWMQGLNMDESLPGSLLLQKGTVMDDHGANQQSSPARHPKLPQLARRNLRNGSAALRRLTAMVGHSPLVYRGIVDLCVALYRDAEVPYIGMKEAALCALRSQLLMSLHDAGETGICSGEPCYKLAWTLDAGFKEKKFERKRLKELESICIGFDEAENTRRAGLSRPHHRPSSASGGLRNGRGGGRLKKRGRDDDAESAGVPGALSIEDPLREIGDAGMVLRDPAPFHLMLHQVMRCLERCVEKQIVPKDDPELILLTRMLTLAVSVRSMLRDQQFYFPESNPEILVTLYPMIAEMMLEAELRDTEEEVVNDPNAAASHPKELVNVMIRDEISRKAVQMYALEQLAAGDLVTGRIAIHAVAQCLERLSQRAIPEFAPFGFTLARRLATLLSDGHLDPSSPLWTTAVDNVLIALVDAETEVHEEVLRLLLAAAPALEPKRLGEYLDKTLRNSRGSRKLHEKRAIEEAALPAGFFEELMSASEYCTAEGVSVNGKRGADGVRGTYQLFLAKQPGLSILVAPALHAYLNATDVS